MAVKRNQKVLLAERYKRQMIREKYDVICR